MKRQTELLFGKIRMTFSRLRTSSISRSTLFVDRIRRRYLPGRPSTAVTSSNPSRSVSTHSSAFSPDSSSNASNSSRASRHPRTGAHQFWFPFYTRVPVAFGSRHPGLPFYRSLRELPIYTVHPGGLGRPNPRSGCQNDGPGCNPGAQGVKETSNPWKG